MPSSILDGFDARLVCGVAGLGVFAVSSAEAQIQFVEERLAPFPTGVSSTAICDLSGDGYMDLVVCEDVESVSFFEQQHNGNFVLVGTHYEPGVWVDQIEAHDLDHDGDEDLVWVVSRVDPHSPTRRMYGLRIFVNSGNGRSGRIISHEHSFRAISIAVGDVNGDERAEISVVDEYSDPSYLRVYSIQSGELVERFEHALPSNDSRDVVMGDFDDDGDLDICVLNLRTDFSSYYGWKVYGTRLVFFVNDGQGGFAEMQEVILPIGGGGGDAPLCTSLFIGDIDGDGDLDGGLSGVNHYRRDIRVVYLVEMEGLTGEPILHGPRQLPFTGFSDIATSGIDFDTDGDLDVLLTQRFQRPLLLENMGDFGFAEQFVTVSQQITSPGTIGDINGDGQFDFVVGGLTGVSIMLNATPYTGPVLSHSDLKRGRMASFVVDGAEVGEEVRFLYSFDGAGNGRGVPVLGGLTTDFAGAIQVIGSATADANGQAVLEVMIPNNAPLRNVVLQAVIRRGAGGSESVKTPFAMTRIAQ